MDRKLTLEQASLPRITADLEEIKRNQSSIFFTIWNEIPAEHERSYYLNEQSVNPVSREFEQWRENLFKRHSPIYSVAITGNQVIASVYSTRFQEKVRVINLWATQEEFRNLRIGTGVLLNLIRHIFETAEPTIDAWDVSSAAVDRVLLRYGFR